MSNKPTVLFIDDDATTRKIYAIRLTMAGLPMHVVESAAEAGKVLEEEQIDVIVTDLMMPEYNGVDLIKAVREADYTKHLPILVFTSGGNVDMMQEAMQAGANEIIQKHTTPPAILLEKIMQAHAEASEKK